MEEKYDFGWFRNWTRVGLYSALESLVRNAVHVIFVLRSMNLLREQDSFWIANTFIWQWQERFCKWGMHFFLNITYYRAKHNCAIMQFNNFREVLNSLLNCAFFDDPKGNKSFFLSRLLLPALPLSDLLKQDIADSRNKSCGLMERMSGYLCLSSLIFCLWTSSYPGWEYFIRTVLNAPEVDIVLDMTRTLMPCFVFFVLGDLMRSGEFQNASKLY